jgi:hypothetical protein
MKKKKRQQQKGFTLIETMVTMSIFFFIMFSVYTMIQHYGDVTKTEHSRMTMQQESRYMVSSFADEIKEAGSILALGKAYMGGVPFFNGIYPLNSTYYPDGIILASGDPFAATTLSQDFSSGDTVLNVKEIHETSQWMSGQKGIILGTTGYLVFSVQSVAVGEPGSITISSTPVYFSGLLNTGYYIDDAQGNAAGSTISYSKNSLVARLTNFCIYLFRDVENQKLSDALGSTQIIRQMIRITNPNGVANPLDSGSGAEFSVISENIWDMQIAYKGYDDIKTVNRSTTIDSNHIYYTEGTAYSTPSDALDALLQDIRQLHIKQLDVNILAIAEDLGSRGETIDPTGIQPFGDNLYIGQAGYLPDRKVNYKLFSFSVEPRNLKVFMPKEL